MIKAIIFDLDDTLISEFDYVKSGYKVIAKKIKQDYNLEKSEDKIYNEMLELFKNNSNNVFNKVLDDFKLDYNKEYIIELVQAYREHIPKIRFFDDVLPCIKKLKKQGIKLGIITDGYAITQKNKLKVLNAKALFDKIIITDELGKEYWKPSPKSFEIMKNYFNLEYDEIVYVGDNPEKDFYIRKIYNITCIRIYRNKQIYRDKIYLNNIKENYKIYNLDQMFSRIKDIDS